MPATRTDLEALRADFPALERRRRGKPPIYLNSACTTLRPRPVIDAVRAYYEAYPTCGGGRAAEGAHLRAWFTEELRERETEAREVVRSLLGAPRVEEIVWTRNTTEAINLLARCLPLEPGDEVLTSENEHNSNLVPWLQLQARLRDVAGDADLVVHRHFARHPDGTFDLAAALAAITPRTRVVAIAQRSNLDGTRVPDSAIRALAERVHAVGGWLFLDAAQSVPNTPVDVVDLGVDFLAFSLHKLCGPSGMGVLYGRYDLLERMPPFLVGGDTVADVHLDRFEMKPPPEKFEAGLQHYAGILGAAAAVTYVRDVVGFDRIRAHERRLNAHLTERLRPLECDHFWLLGPPDADQRGGILTMASSQGTVINAIERIADEESNVMLRKGMFCANAFLHHRFDATGHAKNNLRASMYLYNTEAELDVVADVIERVVKNPLDYLDDA